MEANATFKHFYADLVNTLVMDDPVFIAELYSHDLLPDYVKEKAKIQPTQGDKVMCFLDYVIKPSVSTSDDSNKFNELLKVMELSKHDTVKKLAKKIRASLSGHQGTISVDDQDASSGT